MSGFGEINITPLTDIFLMLLIIFMVMNSVIVQQAPGGAQTGLKVNLPKGGTTDVTARATELSVAVLADGRFVLGGNVVSEDEFAAPSPRPSRRTRTPSSSSRPTKASPTAPWCR